QALVEKVLAIAKGAGEKILAIYNSDFAVQAKDDKSPLTQADLAANRYITEALSALEMKLPVLSEESKAAPFAERSTWSAHWLGDRPDGTKEFIKRNGEFTVNIALIEMGHPILGVVHIPVTGESYAAAEGLGAWKISKDGSRKNIRTRALPAKPIYLVSRSH